MKLPRWFRWTLTAVFLLLIGVVAMVRRGGVREAVASALLDGVVKRYVPTLEQSLAMPKLQPEPPDGAYYLNGMLVQYHTMPAPIGAEEALGRFEKAFHQSGYVTRRLTVLKQPTLVAIHPKTRMLLTVRTGHTAKGVPTVRLAQQDLSQIDSSFRAELPGIPTMPGATNLVLVRSADGPSTSSLTLTVPDTQSAATAYYTRELTALGWSRLMPPAAQPFTGVETLFFEKGNDECYVVASPGASANQAILMVMVTEKGARS